MATVRSLNKRSTTILIAAVLALGTGLLAFNYLSSVNKVATTVQMRSVLVASQDIPVRAVITPAMLTLTNRPADSIDSDAIASPNDAAGQLALISIPTGGTITASKIGRIGLGGLTVRIPAGERAISIALDRVKGVADLIEAGDHVDVIAVSQAHGAGAGVPTVATILTNKTVLAMGSSQETPTAAQASASPAPDVTVETATLSVTPAEAKIIALADLNATLRLALRSIKDLRTKEAAEPFTFPSPDAVTAQAITPAVPVPVSSSPHTVNSPAPKRNGPPLIDGDQFVNR
jgi:pilus assembly protein CpaB